MSLRKLPKVAPWFGVEVLLLLMQEKCVNENWISGWKWESLEVIEERGLLCNSSVMLNQREPSSQSSKNYMKINSCPNSETDKLTSCFHDAIKIICHVYSLEFPTYHGTFPCGVTVACVLCSTAVGISCV